MINNIIDKFDALISLCVDGGFHSKIGGETEFLYQSIRIKPVAGRTLIWPAGYTHVHRGNPPIKGEKMYATGWFEYTLSQ